MLLYCRTLSYDTRFKTTVLVARKHARPPPTPHPVCVPGQYLVLTKNGKTSAITRRVSIHLLRFETSMESMSMTVMLVMAESAKSFSSSQPKPPAPMTRTLKPSTKKSAIFLVCFKFCCRSGTY